MIPDARNAQDAFDGLKPCSKCGGRLPLADFPPNGHTRSGRSSWCRGCHNEASRRWRAERRANAAG